MILPFFDHLLPWVDVWEDILKEATYSALFFMKFTYNIHPTRLFGPTRLIATWE